ncbi:MAG TPA: ribulose-phosphate 3-epimerase [bacterium]|nr:ribulose-phosphate 3-epimerase [bacterium]
MVKIAPSVLAADLISLKEEIRRIEEAGADLVHIDVMAGAFVPNITFGPEIVRAIRKITKLPLDVHLMINNPQKFIKPFLQAGSDILTVHIEASGNIEEAIGLIKEGKKKAGIAINPKTPLLAIEEFLGKVDMVTVMSVHPGFAGQIFIPAVIPKIRELKDLITKRNLKVEIEVDGGINTTTAPEVIKAGADILASGMGIFGSKDIKKAIKKLRTVIGER